MPPTRHRRLEHFFAGWPSQTWALYARNTGGGFGRASVTPSLWAHMSVESISLNSNMTGAGSNGVLDSVSFPQTGDITSPPVRDGRILATQGMGLPDGNLGLAGVTGPHVLYTPIAPVDESTPHLRIAERAFAVTYAAAIVTVTARLEPANLERAEAAILDVIRKVRAEGVTEAERQRALITAESSYAFDIETAEGLAKTYGQAETTWTLDNELAYLSRLRGITGAQIQAVAQKYFGDDNYARVRFVPEGTSR